MSKQGKTLKTTLGKNGQSFVLLKGHEKGQNLPLKTLFNLQNNHLVPSRAPTQSHAPRGRVIEWWGALGPPLGVYTAA